METMKNKFEIGDTVCKKSGKPFKNGSNHQTIVEFGINELDPNKRLCAIFSDGSVCNLDMLNRIYFIDIETNALGIPTGHLSMFSATSKLGKTSLVKLLPIDDKQGEYTVIIEDLTNMDNVTMKQAVDIINRMIDLLRKEGVDMEFIKKVYTKEEVIGDTVFPVTYYPNGTILIDYPTKL